MRAGGVRRFLRAVVVVLVAANLLAAVAVLSLRWVDPRTSALMLQSDGPRAYTWVDAEAIGPRVALAILSNEDQEFSSRLGGVDLSALLRRATADDHRGGSTLQEQLAKNLFLWRHRDPVRKLLLEPPLATMIALEIGKARQLELYANLAQTGPRIWGVCAASWFYFDLPPRELSLRQAAELAAVLPSPGSVRRKEGGGIAFPASRPLASADAYLRLVQYQSSGALGRIGWPPPTAASSGKGSCDRRPDGLSRAG